MTENLRDAALDYHRYPTPGKISVTPTKAMATARDLSLAYSPGVADACMAIAEAPLEAGNLTARSNLVAVITNGTAVLGLGNIGPLAAKPVMEGKGCLFKKFAGIDVFDIELAENDPDALIETIARMEPTFGGINLEDIKAPECFYIETRLRERMKIPVFHDDQHGTAIVAAAAHPQRRSSTSARTSARSSWSPRAPGAAALACLDLAVSLGLKLENIVVSDAKGVVYLGRTEGMDPNKARYARDTSARTLADIIPRPTSSSACRPAACCCRRWSRRWRAIRSSSRWPTRCRRSCPRTRSRCGPTRSSAPAAPTIRTRSTTSSAFPFIFRGALDVGATTDQRGDEARRVRAIAELTHQEIPEVVAQAYGAVGLRFGRDYLIPKPFDPRLIEVVAPAVAQAAMDSGVATRPIADMPAYRQRLSQFVYQSGSSMQPLFAAAKRAPKRVVYAEGEDERVLRAAQVVVDEGLARPLLLGRPEVIAQRLSEFGLRLAIGKDCETVDLLAPAVYGDAADDYFELKRRDGVSRAVARAEMRSRATLLAAMLVRQGRADAMLCGTFGSYGDHLRLCARRDRSAPRARRRSPRCRC
jgi:malate dehydrogenase (oxaloacetate-decarboxylating)(NADP+)